MSKIPWYKMTPNKPSGGSQAVFSTLVQTNKQDTKQNAQKRRLILISKAKLFYIIIDLLQFFSWLNSREKQGHGSFNERFILL